MITRVPLPVLVRATTVATARGVTPATSVKKRCGLRPVRKGTVQSSPESWGASGTGARNFT
jgi:hypothetical protein